VDIAVAVIARPGSSTLPACLDSLQALGAGPTVHEVGTDGASMARNRALADCRAELVAFVEDDVVVEAQWLRALSEAWSSATEDVAVVGGSLRARFPSGRPWWLDPDLDGAFAVLDLGPTAASVDLARRTFHAGNVSYRTAALRGVAGFWPARGHRDGRDWFSDEHHAQHALALSGWRGLYEPAAAAQRLVDADQATIRRLLRRRLRYGARLATAGGGRAATTAARSLATGLVGATVGRDRAVRRTRLLRAAENVGVLLGPRLVRADFEPVARSTPFRPSIPAAARRRRLRRGAVILLYHRIADTAHDPLKLSVAPQRFAEHVDVLATEHRVVTLEELAREREPRTIAITFDDGYADNGGVAAPLLAAARLPWTLFVSTGHVEEGKSFWWDEVVELFARPNAGASGDLRLGLPGGERAWRVETKQQRSAARDLILATLQGLDSHAIARALRELRTWAGTTPPLDRPLDVAEVRQLARSNVAVGAHTRTHRALAHAKPAEQREEIARSRNDLTSWLGSRPTTFSYPFGVPGADLDATSVRIVREEGFANAVINARGSVRVNTDPMALPRWAPPDMSGEAFAAGLRRLLG
jgi:peptidoglycan/xylan/chitin deacetylase (PgdA/CDA1 family)